MAKSKGKVPTKEQLKAELLALLSAELEVVERAQKAAMEGATHAEAKPENDKDTRALEQSYLARGQAKRVEEIRLGIVELKAMTTRPFDDDEPLTLGALVTVEEADKTSKLLIAPQGGGTRLAGGTVQVITPRSPLGEGLVGKVAGDGCEVFIAGKKRELEIISVE